MLGGGDHLAKKLRTDATALRGRMNVEVMNEGLGLPDCDEPDDPSAEKANEKFLILRLLAERFE